MTLSKRSGGGWRAWISAEFYLALQSYQARYFHHHDDHDGHNGHDDHDVHYKVLGDHDHNDNMMIMTTFPV